MLTHTVMREIQSLRQQGYSKSDVIHYFEANNRKAPSGPTLDKYYNMPDVPDNPTKNYAKQMAFDVFPFREEIISILQANPKGKVCISSIYDVLEDKFCSEDSNPCYKMPGSQRALRNFVRYLEASGAIVWPEKSHRIYSLVDEDRRGYQIQIDFGEKDYSKTEKVFFMCLLLRYSRLMCVYIQDHRFTSEEACNAIYRCFQRIGGRPVELVIDQDSVFIAHEENGECKYTEAFGNFVNEQQLQLRVCNKADPETKGAIEAGVAYCKKSFFSARPYVPIQDFREQLSRWVERANNRIHGSTCRIPLYVFETEEKDALRPLLPSVFETTPSSFHTTKVGSTPYITYKSCRYSLPRDCAFKTVHFKVIGDKMHIYDENYNFLFTHSISECAGKIVQAPEHKKPEATSWKKTAERLRENWPCNCLQEFINGVHEAYPRHIGKQLQAIESLLKSEKPDVNLVALTLDECCSQKKFSESAFKAFLTRIKAERMADLSIYAGSANSKPVQLQDKSFYEKAVKSRTVKKEDDV
ncbi:MAG: DDE-type integrase/transposase/recombinase [Coprobacillus sp.]|nr:DDE-type integrase/transposase/recombinase [Coprobacillus sp.]MCD8204952.1 DDE-type integrase/transposase/recombinase [Coprobacillus sp.]